MKELKRFADDIISLRPMIVTFSGGEPLLYDKWYLLAKYIKDKGAKISLTTNGILLHEKFKKIMDVVDELNISLEGCSSFLPHIGKSFSTHAEDIALGLKRLTNFKKHNSNRPIVKILYTISDLSYSHMSRFIKFMERKESR